jgi:hypothetical protein
MFDSCVYTRSSLECYAAPTPQRSFRNGHGMAALGQTSGKGAALGTCRVAQGPLSHLEAQSRGPAPQVRSKFTKCWPAGQRVSILSPLALLVVAPRLRHSLSFNSTVHSLHIKPGDILTTTVFRLTRDSTARLHPRFSTSTHLRSPQLGCKHTIRKPFRCRGSHYWQSHCAGHRVSWLQRGSL